MTVISLSLCLVSDYWYDKLLITETWQTLVYILDDITVFNVLEQN
jgi:hypothetical protein